MRQSCGVAGLDDSLGGGLLPGTLTVVLGASGIGKTQLGLAYLDAGHAQDGRRGVIFDLSARIDSQSHQPYAERIYDWTIAAHPNGPVLPADVFSPDRCVGEYLRIFKMQGRRVNQREVDFDRWHDWQAELAARLEATIEFLYSNFIRGSRRVVIDGIEPSAEPSQSIQHELFEYIYHQVLRKESGWVARDLLRQAYREHADAVTAHAYDHAQVGALMLVTSHESLLDNLIERPMVDGDLLATANTVIYMGKARQGDKMSRALHIAKHRGSACSDEIIPYTIGDRGLIVS